MARHLSVVYILTILIIFPTLVFTTPDSLAHQHRALLHKRQNTTSPGTAPSTSSPAPASSKSPAVQPPSTHNPPPPPPTTTARPPPRPSPPPAAPTTKSTPPKQPTSSSSQSSSAPPPTTSTTTTSSSSTSIPATTTSSLSNLVTVIPPTAIVSTGTLVYAPTTYPTYTPLQTFQSATTSDDPEETAVTADSNSSAPGEKGFLHNTTAIVATSVVAGLVGVAALIAIGTYFLRRSRRRREVEEAEEEYFQEHKNFGPGDDEMNEPSFAEYYTPDPPPPAAHGYSGGHAGRGAGMRPQYGGPVQAAPVANSWLPSHSDPYGAHGSYGQHGGDGNHAAIGAAY